MATEITPEAVTNAIVTLVGLLPGGSAQPEPDLTDDEIAALKARGYEVTKSAEKSAEKPAEKNQGSTVAGITNVTDLLKTAAERVGQSSSPDSLSKITDPVHRADAQVLQEHHRNVAAIAARQQHRR